MEFSGLKNEGHSPTLSLTNCCLIDKQQVFINSKLMYQKSIIPENEFLVELFKNLNLTYPKFYKMDNLAKLAFLCTEYLLAHCNHNDETVPSQTAIILQNSSSSLDVDTRFQETVKTFPSPSLFVYTLPNVMEGELCIRHHLTGEHLILISEKPDFNQLSDVITSLHNSNPLEAVIGGYVNFDTNGGHAFLFYGKTKNDNEVSLKDEMTNTYAALLSESTKQRNQFI